MSKSQFLAPANKVEPMTATVHRMALYRHDGFWCFDHPDAGITQEPFVQGTDKILDELVARDASNTKHPLLSFTADFPLATFTRLNWVKSEEREDGTWNLYVCPRLNREGWLCPRLYAFFRTSPDSIYVRVMRIRNRPSKPITEKISVAEPSELTLSPDRSRNPGRLVAPA